MCEIQKGRIKHSKTIQEHVKRCAPWLVARTHCKAGFGKKDFGTAPRLNIKAVDMGHGSGVSPIIPATRDLSLA